MKKILTVCIMLAGFLMVPANLEAIPAFARKHQLACSQCHSAWPLLNKFGQTFKENGYRLDREPKAAADPGDVVINDRLVLPRALPMSFRVQGRPIVKRNTDERYRMQVVHEFELYIADSAADNYSYFANFEAEDEAGWEGELADLVAGWHPRAQANVVGGYGQLTFADPLNTFSSRRLTQDRPSPNGSRFQSGYRFRDNTPFATFYGRAGQLFYSASAGTGAEDPAGADRKDYLVRAAYDLPGGASLGAFSLIGEKQLVQPARIQEYSRAGVDLQVDSHGFTANALWYRAKENLATTLVNQKNSAWYIQTLYVTPTTVPIVPVFRYESVESNSGLASTQSVALALIAYVRENINVSIDYTKQTKVPPGASKSNRFSVLFMFTM
jgi:hypothetical protein